MEHKVSKYITDAQIFALKGLGYDNVSSISTNEEVIDWIRDNYRCIILIHPEFKFNMPNRSKPIPCWSPIIFDMITCKSIKIICKDGQKNYTDYNMALSETIDKVIELIHFEKLARNTVE